MSLVRISRELSRSVEKLPWSEAAHTVYNPLNYARAPHEAYLKRYGAGPKEVVLLGMNPGPFGMAQTGVPFGDVCMVRDWLEIEGEVHQPARTHPKRPIQGFDCARREVSGTRLWSFAAEHFGEPSVFFQRFFVVNYCPLVFMDAGGRNLTPDKLPAGFRSELLRICDVALRKIVTELRPDWVLGVGGFAQKQALRALPDLPVQLGTILHPSPASPRANRGWAREVEMQLRELEILA